ncbi:plasmid replication initiator TrfA [Flavobacterium sp.]|uniref:plasmid replication initiator TrfA n=1 Tax=Flavobacterium sp. TaxID=239 RepID=UPI002634C6B0|nr:plasmid replication initiator TrfA [Flavobacterium sp.]
MAKDLKHSTEHALGLVQRMQAKTPAKKAIPRMSPNQLPLWRDNYRGLPNAMARSALFGCANKNAERSEYKREQITTLGGYIMKYTGTELRQDDEDVFLQIVHFARMQPLGDVVEISGNALLKALNWNSSKKSYDRLKDIISRLQEGSIQITNENGREGFGGSLVRKFMWKSQDESGSRTKWQIYLEKEIINLFTDDSYSLLDWEDRMKLGSLAKYLHSFFYTHQNPYPYKVETLQGLSGSKTKSLHTFRRTLKGALQELVDINFLLSYSIDSALDIVTVERNTKKTKPLQELPSLI